MWRNFQASIQVETPSISTSSTNTAENTKSSSPEEFPALVTENTPPNSEQPISEFPLTLTTATTNSSLSIDESNRLKTPPPPKPKPISIPLAMEDMFSKECATDRPIPELPSTDGLDYPRAASWSSSTVAEIMRDDLGKQLFRRFLFESLAEENMLFVDQIDAIRKLEGDALKNAIHDLLNKYDMYINISSSSKAKLVEISSGTNVDKKNLDLAYKEVYKLLENDQFPRFRRSELYLNFLEQLLPKSYAEKWANSFDALLGNQVGRHHFRQFLFSIHAEENLRFWEAIIEFRNTKNKSHAMTNMARSIHDQFLKEGCTNEIFLPFGLRQNLIKRIKDKDVDLTLFDDATKHVEQVLKNDPYVRFLASNNYKNLLTKLTK